MKLLATYITIILLPFFAIGQKVDGHISEVDSEGNHVPLVGVNVYWLGTTVGTSTNDEGYFVINRLENKTKLVVSFVGYKIDTLTVLTEQNHVHYNMSSSITL